MVGTKQLERDEVLDLAMAAFWNRGYEATSIDDLVETIGINRARLYGKFGDKKRLFLAALDRYLDTVGKSIMADLSDPDPRRAIERMFDSIVRRVSDPNYPRGCFITNTSLECPTCGDEIARKVAEALGQQESAIYRALRRAQTEGMLASSLDARALARFFLGVAQGINVLNKAVADPDVLKDMVRVAMSVWIRTDEVPQKRSKDRRNRNRSSGSS
jgi:TetR/AcrR family transcriptional repressor of nem operon